MEEQHRSGYGAAGRAPRKNKFLLPAVVIAVCALSVLAGVWLLLPKEAPAETAAPTQPAASEPEAPLGIETVAGAPVGSFVRFGRWEQDGDPANGAEPIEWLVLDKQDGGTLLISRRALLQKRFGCTPVWGNSGLRRWLGSEFLKGAFTDTERSYFLPTDNGETDLLFLLSSAEAETYFPDSASRACTLPDRTPTVWWLRDLSLSRLSVCSVMTDGDIFISEIDAQSEIIPGVRPALWVGDRPVPAPADPVSPVQIDPGQFVVGASVYYGQWEQNEEYLAGPEPIEWLVLDRGGDSALLLSRYALMGLQEENLCTWEESDTRAWLNDEFFYGAFRPEEASRIRPTGLPAAVNPNYATDPGAETVDRIFLLSAADSDYLSTALHSCPPTAYAVRYGAEAGSFHGNCSWMLRSPGAAADRSFAFVRSNDAVNYEGEPQPVSLGIRPAMWVELS